jgi:hypothetical protein
VDLVHKIRDLSSQNKLFNIGTSQRANTMLKSLTASSTLEASAAGSIVTTLTPGLTKIFYSHRASEARSTVWTIAEFFVWTKEYTSSGHHSRNYSLRLVAPKKSSLSRFMMASLYALSRPFRALSFSLLTRLEVRRVPTN